MFKRKKKELPKVPLPSFEGLIAPPPKLVPRVKTFYATHTLGLETQVNTWMQRAQTLRYHVKDVQYAQAKGEFSALIFYLREEDEE